MNLDTKDSESLKIQRSFRVYSRDVDYGSGARSYRENLEREKKKDSNGLEILSIESTMAKNSIYDLASAQQVDDWKKNMESNVIELRKFYYSSKRMKKKRTKELKKKKYVDRLCSEERYFVSPVKDRKRVMFVGDRGLAVGSRLKGFLRYGGLWKPKQHSRYAAVCVTNEHNTSQTCVFCFKKLMHPLKIDLNKKGERTVKKVSGSFICCNQSCPSVKYNMSTHGRDALSALAIAFSGACNLILGMPCPTFNPRISEINADAFQNLCHLFLNKKQGAAYRR